MATFLICNVVGTGSGGGQINGAESDRKSSRTAFTLRSM